MMIDLTFSHKGGSMTLPINPPDLKIATVSDNKTTNVISLGEIVVPGEAKLSTFSVSSFFWDQMDSVSPQARISFFESARDNKSPISFSVGHFNISMLVLISSFEYDRRAQEEDDIYYTISFIQYRPYGARLVSMQTTTTANPTSPPRVDNKAAAPNTYTVVKGDCLWHIAAKFTGSGGSSWRELYDLNKSVVGGNPNLIQPGQTLVLPSGW